MKLTPCYARSWQSRSDARARPLMEKHLWLGTATSRSKDWAGNPALLLNASHNWSAQTTYQDAYDNWQTKPDLEARHWTEGHQH